MDGLWNAQLRVEQTKQGEMSRHRLLRVNLDNLAGGKLYPGDASGDAKDDPNQTLALGPHFILSPETPQNTPTMGFEFCLLNDGMGSQGAVYANGFNVTVYQFIATEMIQDGGGTTLLPWASFITQSMNANQLFHSFDINAGALRFRIVPVDALDPVALSIIIALSEL